MKELEIRKDVKDATTGLSKKGYKGGYLISSDSGWDAEVDTLSELREIIIDELRRYGGQVISIATAFYDEDKWNYDREEYGAYNFDEGWVSSVGGYEE